MRVTDLSPAMDLVQTRSTVSARIDAALATIAEVLPAGWSSETFEGCDGTASLVIMSPGDAAITYLITGDSAAFQLDELDNDELRLVGKSNSVGHLAWLVDTRIRRNIPRRAA